MAQASAASARAQLASALYSSEGARGARRLALLDISGNHLGPAFASAVRQYCEAARASEEAQGGSQENGDADSASGALGPPALCLSSNNIRDAGGEDLAYSMGQMRHLSELRLPWNGMGPIGGLALAKALSQGGGCGGL